MVKLFIPEPLQKFTEGKREIELSASSVNALIPYLQAHYSALHKVLFDQQGYLNGFVNLYLNQNLLTHRLTEHTSLNAADELEIVVAVSGG